MRRLIACLLTLAFCLAVTGLAEEYDYEIILDVSSDGFRLCAMRDYSGDDEVLRVGCLDADQREVWSQTFKIPGLLGYGTDAFIGGTPDSPRLMLYVIDKGLASCDPYTGDVLWKISPAKLGLGESISHAVAKDGTMIIGGWFSSVLVAISADGRLLWQTTPNSDDIYWMGEIKLDDKGILAHYEHIAKDESSGWVRYSWDGQQLSVKKE